MFGLFKKKPKQAVNDLNTDEEQLALHILGEIKQKLDSENISEKQNWEIVGSIINMETKLLRESSKYAEEFGFDKEKVEELIRRCARTCTSKYLFGFT